MNAIPPRAAVRTIRPGHDWGIAFEYGTGMGGLTRLEALRSAWHELRHGRRVTIIPPQRVDQTGEQWRDIGPARLRVA
jgi:hypothetical protein